MSDEIRNMWVDPEREPKDLDAELAQAVEAYNSATAVTSTPAYAFFQRVLSSHIESTAYQVKSPSMPDGISRDYYAGYLSGLELANGILETLRETAKEEMDNLQTIISEMEQRQAELKEEMTDGS